MGRARPKSDATLINGLASPRASIYSMVCVNVQQEFKITKNSEWIPHYAWFRVVLDMINCVAWFDSVAYAAGKFEYSTGRMVWIGHANWWCRYIVLHALRGNSFELLSCQKVHILLRSFQSTDQKIRWSQMAMCLVNWGNPFCTFHLSVAWGLVSAAGNWPCFTFFTEKTYFPNFFGQLLLISTLWGTVYQLTPEILIRA